VDRGKTPISEYALKKVVQDNKGRATGRSAM
jgi:hypothetical protein